MQRQKDIVVREVIAFTDEHGQLAELEVQGATIDGDPTWVLLHVTDAGYRLSSAMDRVCCTLDSLPASEPAALFDKPWPDGLEAVLIERTSNGAPFDEATLRGTRRAIRTFYDDNWGCGDEEIQREDLARITEIED